MTPAEKLAAKTEEWVKRFVTLNTHSEELDDCVHDAASCMASNINCSSVEAQVIFLVENWDEKELEKVWDAIWQSRDNCGAYDSKENVNDSDV